MRLHWGLCLFLASACSSETHTVSPVADSCTTCHTNITQAHPNATIQCIECHGGTALTADDMTALLGASFGDSTFQAALNKAHVHPKQVNADKFLSAGLDGQLGACFRAADDPMCNVALGMDMKDGVGTVDDAVDAEYNRDLNYVRFINPGDLRVANASCGGQSPRAVDYPDKSGIGGCHTDEVSRVRRSIMATQAGVVSAAYLGNLGQLSGPMGNNPAPRGYVLNLDGSGGSDECFHTDTNSFDSACLEGHRAFPANDPLSGSDPRNVGQEVFPATIQKRPDADLMTSVQHSGFAIRIGGIGGQPLDNAKAWPTMEPVSALRNSDVMLPDVPNCAPGVVDINPLDAVLRGFRAYYPLWIPGTGKNFAAVAGNTIKHADDPTKAFNPFGRGHASGCTGCHMLYDFDGKSHERELGGDPMIDVANRYPTLDLVEGGQAADQGMSVVQEQFAGGKKQQRFYPRQHALTSRIPTRQCGYCHTFVTRIDLAYQGMFEVEEGDVLARQIADRPASGDITWTTPSGTKVRIFDTLERVEPAGGGAFHITTDPRVAPYNAALAQACAARGIDCDNAGIFTADFNDNGELDPGEDILGTGELLLPDRIPRRAQTDGRQMRILYGGENGSTQLKDIHLAQGMHCIDCHFYQDVHGDGNIYNTNWETIEIECEDCHGYAGKKAQDVTPGALLTSGPNGGNDLFKSTDGERTAQFPNGRPFFEVRGDKLFQRSRVTPGLEWEVKQVLDTPDMAHSSDHVGAGPRGDSAGKLECYSCHNTFAANCLSCHYQENYSKSQLEVWLADSLQPQKTDFQLFGMIRGPLILGIDGDAEHNRISPFRSSMEAFVSVADCNGNTAFGNVIHSNCRGGKPVSGVGMNNFMPHAVRTDIVKGCETCHTAKDSMGRVVNNHIMAQTLGLGTGRLNDLGDWLFVATGAGLDVVDVKNESELGDTKDHNSFPGFIVGNDTTGGATLRSFSITPNGSAIVPKDVAVIRGFSGSICMQERSVNPDIAIVAGGADGLFVFNVFTPDTQSGGAKPFAHAAGNVQGVDVVGQDISDPIVYAADFGAGLVTYNLTGLDAFALGSPTTIGGTRGTVSNWPAGANARGVKVAGNRAAVAAGDAGLILVDVTNPAAMTMIGQPIPLRFSGEPTTVIRRGLRVAVQNTIAYVATDDGLVAVDMDAAQVIGGVRGAPVNDVALSGHLAYLAAGTTGLAVLDITVPADMKEVANLTLNDATPIGNATAVVVGTVPTQTWAFVADATTNQIRAVNVSTLYDPYRPLQGNSPLNNAQHDVLTLEHRDPFSPRDTTVPAPNQLPVVNFATTGGPVAIARGLMLDRIADESGRRLRDSWNPGNTVISGAQMDRMRAVVVPAP